VKCGIVCIKGPNCKYFEVMHNIAKKLKLNMGIASAFSPSMRVGHYDYKTIQKLIKAVGGLEVVEAGHFKPINSPVWYPYTGLWLEFDSPWFIGFKEKITRSIMHTIGGLEFFFLRKNHFTQSVYVVAKKQYCVHHCGLA